MFPIWASVRAELSWIHYRNLIVIKNSEIRKFYMDEAIRGNWSVRQLERQISSFTYSRVQKHKQEVETIKGIDGEKQSVKYDPNTVIKDPYTRIFRVSKHLEMGIEKDVLLRNTTFRRS